jgi:hypothetical protein
MENKFVFENFSDYLKHQEGFEVNEAEGSKVYLTPKDASEIISELAKSQKRMAIRAPKVSDLVKKTFGEDVLKRMRADWYWANQTEGIVNNPQGDDIKKKDEFFKKIEEFSSSLDDLNLGSSKEGNENYRPAVIMGLFHQFMDESTREELKRNLSKKANELKLTKEKILKQIEEKAGSTDTMGQPPAVLGYTSSEEIDIPTNVPGEVKIFSLLDEKSQRALFIDNSWDLNPEVSKILTDQIYGVIERRKSGGFVQIEEIVISSSASRYRNTGKAESLSWGQLSFKRSQVVYEIIKEALAKYEIPEGDPIREELNKVTKMSISGENGDGTSGPNPTGVRIGYYQTTTKQAKDNTGASKFIEKGPVEKVYATKIDGFGNSTAEAPEEKNMPTLASKEEYDKFKYVNVSIRVKEDVSGGTAPSVMVDKVRKNTIAPEIILERKGKKGEGGGSYKFKLPKIKMGLNFFKIGDINPAQDICGGF